MPQHPPSPDIAALELRMEQLLAESRALQARIDSMKRNGDSIGVVDDTRILAEPEHPAGPPAGA